MLEMRYAINPDEHGVYNGAELAVLLIGDAIRLLAPYVNADRDRVESFFRLLAADEFEKVMNSKPSADLGAFLPTVVTDVGKRATALQAHLAANRRCANPFSCAASYDSIEAGGLRQRLASLRSVQPPRVE